MEQLARAAPSDVGSHRFGERALEGDIFGDVPNVVDAEQLEVRAEKPGVGHVPFGLRSTPGWTRRQAAEEPVLAVFA